MLLVCILHFATFMAVRDDGWFCEGQCHHKTRLRFKATVIYSQHFCQTLNGFTASENGCIIVFSRYCRPTYTQMYMHVQYARSHTHTHGQTHYNNDLD